MRQIFLTALVALAVLSLERAEGQTAASLPAQAEAASEACRGGLPGPSTDAACEAAARAVEALRQAGFCPPPPAAPGRGRGQWQPCRPTLPPEPIHISAFAGLTTRGCQVVIMATNGSRETIRALAFRATAQQGTRSVVLEAEFEYLDPGQSQTIGPIVPLACTTGMSLTIREIEICETPGSVSRDCTERVFPAEMNPIPGTHPMTVRLRLSP